MEIIYYFFRKTKKMDYFEKKSHKQTRLEGAKVDGELVPLVAPRRHVVGAGLIVVEQPAVHRLGGDRERLGIEVEWRTSVCNSERVSGKMIFKIKCI
jgi:hypothetical protein